ncbi:sigma-54 interaction domain-containing protein [Hominifimenecus sp. rT4P-3]|uniref:sigma-54 interaction domain-containing protein n=1 Tax=Hominifimenecus sp. rT4P-3 TaxID=3242979 RepID=UPI003DA23033
MKITYLYTTEEQRNVITEEEKNYSFEIQKRYSTRENCLQLAREAEQDGSFLIVASGFQYDYLATQQLRISLVSEIVTLSNFWGKIYEVTHDLKIPHPTLLLCPSWELSPQETQAIQDIFQVRLVEMQLSMDEIFGQRLPLSKIQEVIRAEKCDAIIAPITLEATLKQLPIPFYRAAFTPLAAEEIRHTLNHIQQIIQIWEKQQKLNSRTEMMMRQSYSAIFCLDEQGQIQLWNSYAEQLFHQDRDEFFMKKIWEAIPCEDQNQFQQAVEDKRDLLGHPFLLEGRPLAVSSSYFPNSREFIFHFSELSPQANHPALPNTERHGHIAHYHFEDIIGRSEFIQKAKQYAKQFSRYNSSVLICGESGTGKEMFAQSIHNESLRREGPFVAINCSTIPASLMESELFGYAAGAFTGANRAGKKGLFELADHGTIFLDEISELSFEAQAQLLRILAERSLMRVGDHTVRSVDIRIIAATNRNLLQMVNENRFRADLYYRLNVLSLEIEPLRQRTEDILPIFHYYFDQLCRREKKFLTITKEACAVLTEYSWPGNIRQLRNFCERIIVIAANQQLDAGFIRSELRLAFSQDKELSSASRTVAEEEKRIRQALTQCHGKRKDAAAMLEMHPSTLWRKMKLYGIG